jgi:3-polyprenyl-4-hydroxybenzoate decarboxylase
MNRMMSFVDEDVDVTNPAEVTGAMATRWDSKTQNDVRNCCWTLYLVPPSLQKTGGRCVTMSPIIIDTVPPFHWMDKFPKPNEMASDLVASVRTKWKGRAPFRKIKQTRIRNPGEARE